MDTLRALSSLPPPACHVIHGKDLEAAAREPSDFVHLNDTIVDRLGLRLDDLLAEGEERLQATGSWEAAMHAKALLERFRSHTHYARLAHIPLDRFRRHDGECPTPAELQSRWGLPSEAFLVQKRTVNHGDGDRNPMDRVRFFKTDDVEERAQPLPEDVVSTIPFPRRFESKFVCVYFKGPPHERQAAKAIIGTALANADDDGDEPELSQGVG